MARVFRVQDSSGRGPFRPGFSDRWLDDDIGSRAALPSWMEEFGWDAFDAAPDGAYGFSAVTSINGIRLWFSTTERERLDRLGFATVEVPDATIVASSPNQVLCWRVRPLTAGVMRRRMP